MATDQADAGNLKLRFDSGRFEGYIVSLIISLQLSLGMMAVLALAFWVHAAPDDGHWYPGIFVLAVAMGVVTYLLQYLYDDE